MNKTASVILFDVGCRKLSTSDDSFFEKAKRNVERLIMMKMLAEDSDEMGVILFGSEITEHCMPKAKQDNYFNVYELCSFGKPGFKLLEDVGKLHQCKGYVSDWALALIVAVEYLKNGVKGKRFKERQIVLISEFNFLINYDDAMFTNLASCMKNLHISLKVVGPKMEFSSGEIIPEKLKPILKLFRMIDKPVAVSMDELTESVKFFEKKRRASRVFNVDLEIGGSLKIPVGWFKLTSESQRFTRWVDKPSLEKQVKVELSDAMQVDDSNDTSSQSSRTRDDVQDTFKVANFGDTKVNFSSADLKALKRETGPPSFKILMFTPKNQINPTMYVGEDVFAVVPRANSTYSLAKLYALIDAMRQKNRVAIARRILMANGKIHLGVLIPFSDDCGKHLYFLKLPTAEWIQPYPRNRSYPENDPELMKSFRTLFDSMKLSDDLVEEGKGILVPNLNFQLRCQLFSQRGKNSDCDLRDIPQYMRDLALVSPECLRKRKDFLEDIVKALPMLDNKKRKQATKDRQLARAARKQEKLSKAPDSSNNQKDTVDPKNEPSTSTDNEVDEDEKEFLSALHSLSEISDVAA